MLKDVLGARTSGGYARLILTKPFLHAKPPKSKGDQMASVLNKEKQIAVVQLLVEGNSVWSISRITGVNLRTCLRILVRLGNACQSLLDERMRDLSLRHIQCDEIWTYVQKKQARVPLSSADPTIGDQFVYVALDTDT